MHLAPTAPLAFVPRPRRAVLRLVDRAIRREQPQEQRELEHGGPRRRLRDRQPAADPRLGRRLVLLVLAHPLPRPAGAEAARLRGKGSG